MLKEGSIMGARSIFTKEFKERAVELALNTNRKQTEIAQDLGINWNMPTRWMREMKQRETGPMKAFTGRGNARDEQMVRLRKENADLRETIGGKPKRVVCAACKKTQRTRADRPGALEVHQSDR
jgi:transposase